MKLRAAINKPLAGSNQSAKRIRDRNSAQDAECSQKAIWGLINRKPRWGLSLKGALILLLTFTVTGLICLFTIHPFLAVTHRESTDILVVEGWVNQYIIRVA